MPNPTAEVVADQIRRNHPQLQVQVHIPAADELADLGLDSATREVRIASTGPGSYAIPVPTTRAETDPYELYWVNVDHMPGDGDLLGSYPTALDAANAASVHDRPTARQ